MPETLDCLAEISKNNLPLSLIIVGVGEEDFTNMVKLDGDHTAVRRGVKDLVQFVKYSDVAQASGKKGGQGGEDMTHFFEEILAAQILEEVPQQFVNCYLDQGKYPPGFDIEDKLDWN